MSNPNYQYNPDPNSNQQFINAIDYKNSSPFFTNDVPQKQFNDFSGPERVTQVFDQIVVPEHTFVISSTQRDTNLYPDPSYYQVDLGQVYKNVSSIELKGAIIPNTSYNVHSTNQYIDFSIGSTITSIKIVYGGAGYTNSPLPTITISQPPVGGTQATATAIVNTVSGQIVGINITNAGSGYTNLPRITVSSPPIQNIKATSSTATTKGGSVAILTATVGTHYSAYLRPGQYSIGGNIDTTTPILYPSGLILEIQDAMNYAVSGTYVHGSTSGPFSVSLVSQYPQIGAISGSPENSDTNATQFNRIQITNVNSAEWALLWASGPNESRNAHTLLGFDWSDQFVPATITAITVMADTLIFGGTGYRAQWDYCLTDSPDFVIIKFYSGSNAYERLESEDPTLNRAFGTILFSPNNPNVITNTTGTNTLSDQSGTNVNYLNGLITKGTFWAQQGYNTPQKGQDYDIKKLELSPVQGKLSTLTINFCKIGVKAGGIPQKYDFMTRDHVLIFGIKSSDQQNSQNS